MPPDTPPPDPSAELSPGDLRAIEAWLGALRGSAVPVPRPLAFCDDAAVIGSDFYLMDEVPGRVLEDPRLPGLPRADRHRLQDAMARVLAGIHEVDTGASGLADYGPGGDYLARQLARWSGQFHATDTGDLPQMARLIAWLERNLPADDGQRGLVHGDYRLDNLILDATTPEIRAVIDWELSTLGHPYADLASVIMQWSLPPGPGGCGLAGVDRSRAGLMTDVEFVAAYRHCRGLPPITDFDAYLAFSHFRMAAILQGVKKRALDGNATNPCGARRLARHISLLVRQGLEIAERAGG